MDGRTGSAMPLQVTLFSFGFKYGLPEDINYLWDVRFLPNPFWVAALRERTGREKDVADYAIGNATGREFMDLLGSLVRFLVETSRLTQKESIRLAVGCTGGRHRSVAVVEALRAVVAGEPVELTVFHRDIDKG